MISSDPTNKLGHQGLPEYNDDNDHKEHYGADDPDEAQDLLLQSRQTDLGLIRKFRDLPEHSLVSRRYNNSGTAAGNTMCSLQADVSCLKVVGIS
jgi:hypothetical protein